MSSRTTIGVLALQGGVIEHCRSLDTLGVDYRLVRRNAHLKGLDGLILPGGESTTMSKLLVHSEMVEPLKGLLDEGLPAYGTCAGMILLATTVLDTRQDAVNFSALNITVRRNAFGRQTESFETYLDVTGCDRPVEAVFIRAPWVEEVGDGVDVLSTVTQPNGTEAVVAVKQGAVMATSFHPEVTTDTAIHELFLNSCVRRGEC